LRRSRLPGGLRLLIWDEVSIHDLLRGTRGFYSDGLKEETDLCLYEFVALLIMTKKNLTVRDG